MKKNVLIAIPNFRIGGAENLVKHIITHLDTNRFKIHLLLLDKVGEYLEDLNQNKEIEVLHIPYRFYIKFNLFYLFKLIILLRSKRIQIVHTHLGLCNFLVRIAAVLSKSNKIIVHEHGSINRTISQRITNFILQIFTDKIIFISKHDLDYYCKKDFITNKKKQILLNNPCLFEFKALENRKENVSTLGMVGRIEEFKGHIYALKAYKILNEKGYKLTYYLVGGGNPKIEKNLQKYAIEHNINIIFTGAEKNIGIYYNKFDILIHPSLSEGFGLVILEAMAFGIPVIATRVGGITDILIHRYNGFLVNPKSPSQISEAIETLIKDKELVKSIKVNAIKTIEDKFSLRNYMYKLENIYME